MSLLICDSQSIFDRVYLIQTDLNNLKTSIPTWDVTSRMCSTGIVRQCLLMRLLMQDEHGLLTAVTTVGIVYWYLLFLGEEWCIYGVCTRLTCFWIGQTKRRGIINTPNIYTPCYKETKKKKMLKEQWSYFFFIASKKFFFHLKSLGH